MPVLSWQLRYKLLNVYVDTLPLSEKVNILSNAVALLQEAPFVHLFNTLTQCYTSFDELKNQTSKTDEMVLEDAEATSKMENEALDSGSRDVESEIVQKGEALSQQLRNYLSIFDVITHIFTPNNDSLPYIFRFCFYVVQSKRLISKHCFPASFVCCPSSPLSPLPAFNLNPSELLSSRPSKTRSHLFSLLHTPISPFSGPLFSPRFLSLPLLLKSSNPHRNSFGSGRNIQ